MSTSWENFERFKQRGLDARRAGDWSSANTYLREAAKSLLELSRQPGPEELREARLLTAQRLLELAKQSEQAAAQRRPVNTTGSTGSAAAASEDATASQIENLIVRERPSMRFADVAGLETVKEEIRLKMLYPFAHPEAAARYGIRGGGGLLMYGPPGTGKTMLARATAGELDATFFRVSAADLLSKWVGQAEQNVQKLFDAAAGEQRAIIFIDEIEALVPARRDDGSSVMQRVVPQILQGMEGFDKEDRKSAVMFLAATNVPWQLDPAVLRPGRFDQKVYIPLPDLAARARLLELYLGKRPLDPALDYDDVARTLDGYSGADIRFICDRAALIPFMQSVATGNDSQITRAMLEQAKSETAASVRPESLARFEAWASANLGSG